MLADRTVLARPKALDGSVFRSSRPSAPRAAWICRLGSPRSIGFALILLMLVGILPAVGAPIQLDNDGNGVEDLLDEWMAGRTRWEDLRQTALAATMAPYHDRSTFELTVTSSVRDHPDLANAWSM